MKKNFDFKVDFDVAAKYIEEHNKNKGQRDIDKIDEATLSKFLSDLTDRGIQVNGNVNKWVDDYATRWVERTVNVKDWYTYRMINFWKILNERDLTNETIISIQEHQLMVLDAFVSSLVKSRIKDESLIEESRRCILIDKNLNILNDFLIGTPKDISNKRAKNIIEFEDASEVLVLFDEIINNRYLAFEKYTIYSVDNPNNFSSYFVACYLLEYKRALKTLQIKYSDQGEYISPTDLSQIKINDKPNELRDIVSEDKLNYIIKLLEDLSITKDGKSMLSPRRKSVIRGVVEGLRECNVLPNQSLNKLCRLIASQIGLDFIKKLDWSKTSDEYHKLTVKYIKDNPLH